MMKEVDDRESHLGQGGGRAGEMHCQLGEGGGRDRRVVGGGVGHGGQREK